MLVVVGLLAVTNLTARDRQRRDAARTDDIVSATVVVTADAASLRPGSVALTVSATNAGPPARLGQPRIVAPGYRLEGVGAPPAEVATGTTVLVHLQLRAACRAEGDAPPALVVPLIPRSGRLHELTAGMSPDLYALACGLRSPAESAHPAVADVHLEPYAVNFRLTLANASARPFRLTGLRGEGLALTAVGGLPVDIPPSRPSRLRVRLFIPSCAQLPTPLDEQRIESLPFAAFELELADAVGRPSSLPFLVATGSDLYIAVRTLAHKICPPGSYRFPG